MKSQLNHPISPNSVQPDLAQELQRWYNCSPDELVSQGARYQRLLEFYGSTFSGHQPTHIVRAPGRVNLIGEHTDYNGYPVLPMAIDRDFVFILAAQSDSTVELLNEHQVFGRRSFVADFPIPPFQQGDWGNYVKAAVHGILEAGWIDNKNARGFKAVVGGTIPESAGLSSSSALVVASALAFLAANDCTVDKRELAELLARAERYVGSEGGGMDQAVSLLAEPGKALKIDFFPLRTEAVSVPDNLAFVVCNSLVRAPKSESVQYAYNRRVIECRLATALLANDMERRSGKRFQASRLADLSAEDLGLDQHIIEQIAFHAIGERPLTLNEIAGRLGEPAEQVQRRVCALRDGSLLAEPPEGFKVWNRFRHVVSEARRVQQTMNACRNSDAGTIGVLMNQSHASCRDDYEISCPELEALVSIGRAHGAIGSRLTGAGFGGCTVHAVPSDQVHRFMGGMTAEYYQGYVKRERERSFSEYTNIHDVIFLCRATAGAAAWQRGGEI